MHIPENVELWESPGRDRGLPNCNYRDSPGRTGKFTVQADKTMAKNRGLLKRATGLGVGVLLGIVAGVIAGVLVGLALARVFGLI
jgi:hypothetical protein